MVLKSKKSKSKRTTLKHKYKVIKKVKQHLKKKAKEEKKARASGKKTKAPKDPGIPSQWPFKEELLKDLEWQKQRILDQEKSRKANNKLKRAAEAEAEDDVEMGEASKEAELQQQANEKEAAFTARKKARLQKPNAASDKDGSKRAFFKEFVKVVSAADVIIEVLDARDPLGSRCKDVERYVRQAGSDKKIILLLNKTDLVPREVAEAWLKYLREELPTVAFKCSTQKQASNLGQSRPPKGGRGRGRASRQKGFPSLAMQGSDSLGAEALLQLLKNYTRNMDVKTSITVGVVGLPNVGKSSLINSLKRARVAQVGNAPGITKSVQQIALDKHISLLDSPGMVFSNSESGDAWAALRNCIKVEQVEAPELIAAEVLKRCPAKQLMALYKVPAFKDCDEFLQSVAFQRGKLLPGGIGDAKSAARVVLHDWHNGKIAYYTLPPARESSGQQEAAIMPSFGEAFNADKVFANESKALLNELPTLEDSTASFFSTETAGNVPMSLDNLQRDLGDIMAMARDSDSESDSDSDSEAADSDDDRAAAQRLPGLNTSTVEEPTTQKKKGSVQAEKLYTESNQFNPAAARAEKKRRKKEKKVSLGDDFDFAEAFADEVVLNDDDADGLDEEYSK